MHELLFFAYDFDYESCSIVLQAKYILFFVNFNSA